MIVDKIGYGKLVLAAFVFHVASALVTFGASAGQEQMTAYQFLYWGTFIFALANGTLEAVANPLVSTLFPKNRTHYLNILHGLLACRFGDWWTHWVDHGWRRWI